MVSESFLVNIVTVVALTILVGTLLLPKRGRYAVHSLMLLALGTLPILYRLEIINFTFGEAGIIKYVVAVVVVFTARSLVMEGVKEESFVKWLSILMGVVIIVLTAVPALHSLGALTFTIPQYPPLVDNIIYIAAAVLLFAGIFLTKE